MIILFYGNTKQYQTISCLEWISVEVVFKKCNKILISSEMLLSK